MKTRNSSLKRSIWLGLTLATLSTLPLGYAFADENDEQSGTGPADGATGQTGDEEFIEEVIVTGTLRQTLQNSIDLKRNSTVIADALVGSEIGDLPDLSVAESLERITGVTSDRFKGGASEISVRGLGAYLGSSLMNGREISSGSDGRDVNFGQFPSELVSGTVVYKSQQASFVEGGVSGIIELKTIRPLDAGERQFNVKGLFGYSDYENRVDGGHPYSTRVTGLYTDQFDTGIGEIGISVGAQLRDDTAPEDIFTTSSTFRPCNTIEGVDRSNNCAYLQDSGGNPTGASDTYFVSNQYIYRAMQTDADRNAMMTNLQWRPNDDWDINLDLQYSNREDLEKRHNMVIADGRRDIAPISISPTGALEAWSGETRLENQSVYRTRDEKYLGTGLNLAWTRENLTIIGDIAYSKTKRRQDEKDMRIRTDKRVYFDMDTVGVTIPNLELTDVSAIENDLGIPFDYNNHDMYDDGARARRRLENVDDEIFAIRLDTELRIDGGAITSFQSGLRYSNHQRVHDDGMDTTLSLVNGYDSDAVISTRRDVFPVRNLYTGADTDMKGFTWATWDPAPLFTALTGDPKAGLPTGSTLTPDDTDVTENSYAIYGQLNFDTTLFGKASYGNFGLRGILTKTDSVGVSSALATEPGEDPDTIIVYPVGEPIVNTESNSYWNWLPSANLTIELTDDKLLRFAAYRAIARPDMEAMSAALSFDNSADLEDIGSIVSASGNPYLEPLKSDNLDFSFEWYFDESSVFSTALYYKHLKTGLEPVQEVINLIVDGELVPVNIGRLGNSDESSHLYGIELSVSHMFTNLPGAWSGLGIQAGYNYADSNFEYPDPTIPDGTNALADFTEPANIPGYSKHSGNVSVFWEGDKTSIRLAYKERSMYFKPFRNDANRYTASQGFLDFSARYRFNKLIAARFQALNILDEPNIFYRPTTDSFAQADYSGRRLFLGLDFYF